MTKRLDQIKAWAEAHKDFLKICFVSVLFWGIVAHGFMFMHWDLSHDSLKQFYFGDNSWRYALGRIFVPFYSWLMRRNITIPWLVGMYAMAWLFLTVIVVCSIFSVRSKWKIFLISGFLVSNECVTALTGSYLSDLDCDMVALLLAVSAVYCWKRNNAKKSWILGSFLLSVSLGFYQSYLSVAVTLVLIILVLGLFKKTDVRKIVRDGLRALGMFACGGLLYIVWLKCANLITGVSLAQNSYNSITSPLNNSISDILRNIFVGWAHSIYTYLRTPSLYGKWISIILNSSVCLLSLLFLVRYSKKIGLKKPVKVLAGILLFLIPIAMDVSYILAGFSHDLMRYAHCFFQVFLIILVGLLESDEMTGLEIRRKSLFISVSNVMLCLSLLGNVMTSNALYVKKDLEAKSTLSLFTRIADRIESIQDYIPGETPVVFVGHPDALIEPISGLEDISRIIGNEYRSATSTYYKAYFEFVLQRPIKVIYPDEDFKKQKEISEMPCFPDKNSVQWINGEVVVKLND